MEFIKFAQPFKIFIRKEALPYLNFTMITSLSGYNIYQYVNSVKNIREEINKRSMTNSDNIMENGTEIRILQNNIDIIKKGIQNNSNDISELKNDISELKNELKNDNRYMQQKLDKMFEIIVNKHIFN